MTHYHHQSSSDKKAYLEGKERREALPPEAVLDLVTFGDSGRVLDLGAGTGYLTLPAAERTEGRVYALDRDREMLELIEARAAQDSLTNIQTIEGEMNQLPFAEASVEVVLASLVLHEAPSLAPVLEEVQRVLVPGGSLVIVELENNSSHAHNAPRVSPEQMEEAVSRVGLHVTGHSFPASGFYTTTAIKNQIDY
ncbi:class I SAM-dependent methyltransferase [Marinococcus halophilus]|uniref:SAM-dependent methyltransferase n=1 Tax=Marinococcus halophilus TaxID=1371 RepID=A0A510Y6T8_MARHA|nr:class I SAM-dependent methyltransferase [Marinococcus halophilus]OZT79724.1 class I SAM-dependent methyltransferase [Marinococcus halophilus]GEK59080.1 SAM-dependent methyltransferase [Marinococcus halophilus]